MKSIVILIILFAMTKGTAQQQNQVQTDSLPSERFKEGLKKLSSIDGEAGTAVIESLQDISPDLGKYIIEYPFGDIYRRDILNDKTKEIAVVAALTAMGTAKPQLKVHINAALNVGVTQEELTEIMILMSVYAGFPAALNGTFVLKDVVTERNTAH